MGNVEELGFMGLQAVLGGVCLIFLLSVCT